MKDIPIKVAQDIADKYDYDQVIIIARNIETGGEHVTTYGKTSEHCSIKYYLEESIFNKKD